MKNYFTPSNLFKSGFIGNDVNTTTAMYEYGILARRCRQGKNKGKFEVVIPKKQNVYRYGNFTAITFDSMRDCIEYYDWIDLGDVESFADFKLCELENDIRSILLFMSAVLSYYGVDNL